MREPIHNVLEWVTLLSSLTLFIGILVTITTRPRTKLNHDATYVTAWTGCIMAFSFLGYILTFK